MKNQKKAGAVKPTNASPRQGSEGLPTAVVKTGAQINKEAHKSHGSSPRTAKY